MAIKVPVRPVPVLHLTKTKNNVHFHSETFSEWRKTQHYGTCITCLHWTTSGPFAIFL